MPFESALGLCLAQDVQSDVNMPPFDRSAMDGYAVIAEDTARTPVELTVIEDIAEATCPRKGAAWTGIQDYDWRCRTRKG